MQLSEARPKAQAEWLHSGPGLWPLEAGPAVVPMIPMLATIMPNPRVSSASREKLLAEKTCLV